MQIEILIAIAVCVSLNLILVVVKYNLRRWRDFFTDIFFLTLVAMFFSSSFYALVVGTFASLIVSIYIYFKPPKPLNFDLDL